MDTSDATYEGAFYEGDLFTEFLEETKNKVNGKFTTMKWLSTMDADSLVMLDEYLDNFNEDLTEEEINSEEAEDVIVLSSQLFALESKEDLSEWEIPDIEKSVQALMALVAIEGLRRKGIAKITGEGTLFGESNVELTDAGKSTNSEIEKIRNGQKGMN